MTPNEQAKKLIEDFYTISLSIEWGNEQSVKEAQELTDKHEEDFVVFWQKLSLLCSINMANQFIECLPSVKRQPPNNQKISKYTKEYWEEVKTELEKL